MAGLAAAAFLAGAFFAGARFAGTVLAAGFPVAALRGAARDGARRQGGWGRRILARGMGALRLGGGELPGDGHDAAFESSLGGILDGVRSFV